MKQIESLRKRLEVIGGSLDDEGGYSLHCDAPDGYVWVSNGMPSLSIHYATNSQTWLTEAIKMEMPNLKMGLAKVIDAKELAEHQWNLGDDNWKAADNAPNHIDFN